MYDDLNDDFDDGLRNCKVCGEDTTVAEPVCSGCRLQAEIDDPNRTYLMPHEVEAEMRSRRRR